VKIILVAGARPNFIKIAPLIEAIRRYNGSSPGKPIQSILVHTGQHYDYQMSQVFFKDLDIPEPDIHLEAGSGTHAQQTGKVMVEFEKVLLKERPELVIVVGDVNSTLGAAVSSAKLHIPVAHVEAGLRSYDREMPEEVNRVLTDVISDYLFVPTRDAVENLRKEGVPQEKIYMVGNVMADSLVQHRAKAEQSAILSQLKLEKKGYGVITVHRPSNVDDRESLARVLTMLGQVSSLVPLVFPAHPRTRKNIERFGLQELVPESSRLRLIEPLGYLDFVNLVMNSRFVITDSGGVQEETTILNIPCITWRERTEWVITLSSGTNVLVGNDADKAIAAVRKILDSPPHSDKKSSLLDMWDGNAAVRIIEVLVNERSLRP